MGKSTGARKVFIFDFTDDELTKTSGEKLAAEVKEETWSEAIARWVKELNETGWQKPDGALTEGAKTVEPMSQPDWLAKATQNLAEPTESELRARQREAVTRATAVIQKALEKLDVLSRTEMVEELFVTGAYDNSEATAFANPLTNYLKALVADAFRNEKVLPVPKVHTAHPNVIINSTDLGTASMYLLMPPSVADFARTLTARW